MQLQHNTIATQHDNNEGEKSGAFQISMVGASVIITNDDALHRNNMYLIDSLQCSRPRS